MLIAEDALPDVAKLKDLEYLDICDTDINDAGLLWRAFQNLIHVL